MATVFLLLVPYSLMVTLVVTSSPPTSTLVVTLAEPVVVLGEGFCTKPDDELAACTLAAGAAASALLPLYTPINVMALAKVITTAKPVSNFMSICMSLGWVN